MKDCPFKQPKSSHFYYKTAYTIEYPTFQQVDSATLPVTFACQI
jgi:hypothetical protein